MDKREFNRLQAELGITFTNSKLLEQAFTHSSYVNEHRSKQHNERLEFLGDAVLELAVSEYLFRTYPKQPEGQLTKLRAAIVCEPSLHGFACELDFGRYILLGRGEELTGGRTRPALLADVFESFVGALYLDQGLEAVVQFLRTTVFDKLKLHTVSSLQDAKSRLQEYVQQLDLGQVQYRLIDEIGPAHGRRFVSEVSVGSKVLGKGSGRTKKESEQQAAAVALEQLGDTQK